MTDDHPRTARCIVMRSVRRWWNRAWLPPWLFRMTRMRHGWQLVESDD